MSGFKKVLVANRGEIALRVIRALKEMGIASAAVYSEADRSSLHVLCADEAYCIGPAPARESYLDMNAVLTAAKLAGADAIHPGYGFLSENAEFASRAEKAGFVFIGPKPETMELLGYKSTARRLAEQHGVPITPGTKSCVGADCSAEARRIGFPVIVKAAAGGGGKGMRVVREEKALSHEVHLAQSEAKAAFGDGSVYLERYFENPRHIEIQLAADSHGNAIAFPERECSIQRRHQKLVEESPSPVVDAKLRGKLAEAALKLAKASKYCGVGTVEFLLDQNGGFYFMEVNTRLQVEHPVTEAVSGVDLVREQILIAQGEKLSLSQAHVLRPSGHAIEHRINAEDPENNFSPCPGMVEEWITPGGPGVRLDSHIYAGYSVPSYYDSLLAKLIVWGPDRKTALARSGRALAEFRVCGIKTTIGFHRELVANADFREGRFDTHFVARMAAAKTAK